jgi:hypothetical protein
MNSSSFCISAIAVGPISIPFPSTRIHIRNHPEGGRDDLAQAEGFYEHARWGQYNPS